MHMADALLAPVVATTMYVASGATTGISIKNLNKSDSLDKLPVMGVMSAFVFAGQMINYTIPGTGSSGHLCGGFMLSALLGPYAGFLSMMVILLIQCLFFADGGLMALGANVWNMAYYGCFLGYFLIYKPIIKSKIKNMQLKLVLASVVGCIVTLQCGAFSVCLETHASGITELPFGIFVATMQPIHLAIGLVEGLITAAVLVFVYQTRPEILEVVGENESKESKLSFKNILVVLAICVVVIAGIGSQFASSNPDGLEWSLFEQIQLDEEEYGVDSSFAQAAQNVQDKTAFLPDYTFASEGENPVGTSVAGILGSAIVAALAFGLGILSCKKKKVKVNE